ncbi:unnamed protein product [Durusdinium trenchii]|uniref:PLOD1-3-like GT domain-containing protein n=1 Tax=Durusdinium trenchii TaxID=1381693 RepID=A0ABP0HZ88_9DINO
MAWALLLAGLLPSAKAGAWQEAMKSSEDFEVISFVTALDPTALMRTNLLESFPLKVTLLGLEPEKKPWTNLRKLQLLHQHVAKLPPEKVVFAIDFFDVVWLHCQRDLVEIFKSFGRPMVFSAELHPYPISPDALERLERAEGYPLLAQRKEPLRTVEGKTYKYLNSGCLVGYAGALKLATARMLQRGGQNRYVRNSRLASSELERVQMQMGIDDQIAWHTYALHHSDEIALDYDADLFLSVLSIPLKDFVLKRGQVWAEPFGRPACFVHGNGASNMAIYVAQIQQLAKTYPGLQPGNCSEVVKEVGNAKMWELNCDDGVARAKPRRKLPRKKCIASSLSNATLESS